jgi:opacity protein-like surface antigen
VLALTIGALPAQAQDKGNDTKEDGQEAKPLPVQITPFVSLGSLFSSRIGAAVAFDWTSKLSLEAEIGYRRAVGDLDSSVNLLYDLPRWRRATPYFAAGVGLQEYESAISVSNSGFIRLQNTTLTVNAGGGLKIPVTGKWGYRTDVRWSNGFGRFAPENWRIYNGVTFGAGKR